MLLVVEKQRSAWNTEQRRQLLQWEGSRPSGLVESLFTRFPYCLVETLFHVASLLGGLQAYPATN